MKTFFLRLVGYCAFFFAIFLVVIFGAAWLFDDGIPFSPCDNTTASEARSPDGQWKAVAFSRGCGATTADSWQVSILGAGAGAPKGAGNVFVQDGTESGVGLKWLSDSHLQITPSSAKIYHQQTEFGAISISYN